MMPDRTLINASTFLHRSLRRLPFVTTLMPTLVAAFFVASQALAQSPFDPGQITTPAAPASTTANTTSSRYSERADVKPFIDDMIKQGFTKGEITSLLDRARYSEAVVKAIMPAPVGRPKNWKEYRSRFVEPGRIRDGLIFWKNNQTVLKKAAEQYGVPEEYIVAIIGIETIYGRNMGSFRVMDALTTLAFDYPDVPNKRNALFQEELQAFLKWTKSRGVEPFSVLGSYAGAIGIGQFMPSSILKYAVDYDENTFIDLRASTADAIGSVANFLNAHGWQRGRPVIWRIADDDASRGIAEAGADGKPEPSKTLGSYLSAGLLLSPNEPQSVKENEVDTPVVAVDLPTPSTNTEYVLGLQNFYVLTRYNRSFFYAMAVNDLAESLRSDMLAGRAESLVKPVVKETRKEVRVEKTISSKTINPKKH
ncbi:lytic murein transglycosylase B [Ampullimonas aquatilis]|uniref:lytic murein transglycosylase B n=1 Tax=Ampullimonas aquatilis TaxID=1341549 RepID=UPI003C72AE58